VRCTASRSSLDCRLNYFKHTLNIAQHIVVPETQHAIALSFNELRADSISRIVLMLPTINFDDDTRLVACEIRDVGAKSHLSTEMRPI
jgi:hypothetical protein